MDKATYFPSKPKPRNRAGDEIKTYRWQKFRRGVLRRRTKIAVDNDESLCAECARLGNKYRPIKSPHLHHILSRVTHPELTYVEANCEFLCAPHHTLETLREQSGGDVLRVVLCGPPGAGKTTFANQNAPSGAHLWDADVVAQELDMGAYPRSDEDAATLQELRKRWIEKHRRSTDPVWVIVRWPKTAHAIAHEIGAHVIQLG